MWRRREGVEERRERKRGTLVFFIEWEEKVRLLLN
jgi:hypothetical protein